MNNHNFFDYLLVMSIRFKTYKLVGREYLRRLLNEGNDDCHCDCCKQCPYIKEIRAELFKNSYKTFNKSVNWWIIHHQWGKLTLTFVNVFSKLYFFIKKLDILLLFLIKFLM